jgi:hypothetical protein
MLIISHTTAKRLVKAPYRTYRPDDRIELTHAQRRPASMREAIPFINVPGPGQTWQELNQWREAYGLRPVTR